MKFMKLILLIIVLFEIVQLKKQFPSQSTRNYRKYAPNPSYNPLPNRWQTGPRNSIPLQRPHDSYRYGEQLHNEHTYVDSTNKMRQLAQRRLIWK